MRIFLFLALREAQALLAKSLAPSQTPAVQRLRWLAKAETVASILFVCGDASHQILINCKILNDLTFLTTLLYHIASNILKATLLLLYRSLQPKPFLDPTSTTTDILIRFFPYLALPEFDFHPGVSMHHLHFGR